MLKYKGNKILILYNEKPISRQINDNNDFMNSFSVHLLIRKYIICTSNRDKKSHKGRTPPYGLIMTPGLIVNNSE